jgi:uncharacterized membrane protein YbhN (UPF0104 family)
VSAIQPNVTPEVPADSAQVARGLARKIIGAGLFAAVVFIGLALYGDVQKLRHTASNFAVSAFALGLALAAGNYGVRVLRWQYYLRHIGVRIPWGESALVFLAGFVMSVTPGKVGEVFKSLLLYETRGTSIARTAPIVVAERLTDLIALVALTSIGSFAFKGGTLIAASSGAIVGGIWLVCAYRPLGNALLDLCAKLPLLRGISPKLREAYDALLEMTRPAPLFAGSLLALVAWGMECGSLYMIVHGFQGAVLDWQAAVFAYAVATLVGALMMLPGGLGGTEAAMITLLQQLGNETITRPVATATTMLVRIATLWFAVAIGVLALAAHRALHRRPVPADPPVAPV